MIKLELKVEEVQLVLNALSQLPYATVANLVVVIKEQAEKQLAAKNEPTKKQS
jgi:hypothetical protein